MDELGLLRRKLERERRARQEGEALMERKSLDLYRAKFEAQLANRAQSEFLANISHELRTPLNHVIGFSELLDNGLAGELNERQRAYVANILNSARHLQELVNQIIDMALLHAGTDDLHFGPVDIRDAVDACVRLCAARANAAGIEVAVELADGVPTVEADAQAVKKILLNLLGNAIKFTPKGGRVGIRAESHGGNLLTIAVSDTGVGIPPDQLRYVTRPFYQVDGGLTRRHDGAGLGLPISKALVEHHGGTLAIESVAGRGTTVFVRFPVQRPRSRGSDRDLATDRNSNVA